MSFTHSRHCTCRGVAIYRMRLHFRVQERGRRRQQSRRGVQPAARVQPAAARDRGGQ